MHPPMCSHCEENRCFWCGEYVYPADKVADAGGVCHKACHTLMYTEDMKTLAPDLNDAGIPEDDNPGASDPEDLETPW